MSHAHHFSNGLAGSAPLKVNIQFKEIKIKVSGQLRMELQGSQDEQNNSIKHPETVHLYLFTTVCLL